MILSKSARQFASLAVFTTTTLSLQARPGSLDTTFGTGGGTGTDVSYTDTVNAIALQQDGKIVTVGNSIVNGGYAVAIARYTSMGVLDTTFNGTGTLVMKFGGFESPAYGVGIQSDGKIIVTGSYLTAGFIGMGYGSQKHLFVARFHTDGALDTDFGTNGYTTVTSETFTFNNTYVGKAVKILADDRILVAGGVGGSYYAVMRFSATGAFDSSFGSNGLAGGGAGGGTSYGSSFNSLSVQSDGKIVAAGASSFVGSGLAGNGIIARFDENGIPDAGFGTSGFLSVSFGTFYSAINSLAVQSNGRIVIGGQAAANGDTDPASTDFVVARCLSSGALDTSFGGDGIVVTPFETDKLDRCYSVLMLPDGRIVANGDSSDGTRKRFAMVRYLKNGDLDPSFGTGGKVVSELTATGNQSFLTSILQGGGRVVGAGFYRGINDDDFALLRFNSLTRIDARIGTAPGSSLGNDIVNLTGSGQAFNLLVPAGKSKSATVYLKNEGHETDSFTVRGTAGDDLFDVEYSDGIKDVTKKVVAGTYTVGSLAVGASDTLKVTVTALTNKTGKKLNVGITTTSKTDGLAADKVLVKAESK